MCPKKIRGALRSKEHWLFAAAYLPSMLLLATGAPNLLRVAARDTAVLAMVAYVSIGCALPLVRLALSLLWAEATSATPRKPGARFASWALLLNWVPHHFVVLLLGLFMGIESEGLVD